MKIEIGKRAARQAERIDSWWREHRLAAPLLFERELESALNLLLEMPHAGTSYPTPRRPELRRLLLPRTEHHLYYSVERDDTVIAVHAVWSARRRHGPAL